MKRVVVVLCAVLLSLGWVSSAQAGAAAATKPSAPTSAAVVVGRTAAEATLTWSAPAAAGSSPVYGYSTVRDGGDTHFVFWDNARTGTVKYSHSFTNLRPGATYTFVLKAWSNAGSSVGTTVTYTTPGAPAGPAATVYAVNGAGTLVTVPATGGAPVTVVSGADISYLTDDGRGGVYYADRTAHTVVRVAAGSTAPVVIASGLADPSDIAVDGSGAVYIADRTAVTRTAIGGTTTPFYSTTGNISSIAVTSGGVLTVAVSGVDGFVTVAANGAATPRPVTCWRYGFCLSNFTVDSANTLYLPAASGGSGFIGWMRAAGATTEAQAIPADLRYYATGLGPDDTFYLAQTRNFCSSPAENSGQCVPDRAVAAVNTFRPDGTAAGSIAVSNLTLRPRGSSIEVDAAGTLFVNASQGIVSIPRAGGAATVLAAGDYSQLVRTG